jgi:hypothetical protein
MVREDAMSLEKKSVHARLHPDIHGMLSVLAEAHERDMAELASAWLEKAIVGEFHAFRIATERMNRLGLTGIDGEREGR